MHLCAWHQVAEDVTGPDSVFPPSTCLGMVLLRPPPAEAEPTLAPSANADAEASLAVAPPCSGQGHG